MALAITTSEAVQSTSVRPAAFCSRSQAISSTLYGSEAASNAAPAARRRFSTAFPWLSQNGMRSTSTGRSRTARNADSCSISVWISVPSRSTIRGCTLKMYFH
jgi:hypothetical protein